MTAPVTERTRTITWTDPVEYAGRLAGLSGLDAMQAIVDGDVPVPPIGQLMDFRPIEGRRSTRCSPSSRPSSTTTRSASSTAAWR